MIRMAWYRHRYTLNTWNKQYELCAFNRISCRNIPKSFGGVLFDICTCVWSEMGIIQMPPNYVFNIWMHFTNWCIYGIVLLNGILPSAWNHYLNNNSQFDYHVHNNDNVTFNKESCEMISLRHFSSSIFILTAEITMCVCVCESNWKCSFMRLSVNWITSNVSSRT